MHTQNFDAPVAGVSATTIASSSNTFSSKGAIPRTSRSNTQSADTATDASFYDRTLSTDLMQRSSRSTLARPAVFSNTTPRSSFFSLLSAQPNVSITKPSSSTTNIHFSAAAASKSVQSAYALQPPNGLNNISSQQLSALMSAELQRHNQDILSRINGLASQIFVIT